MSDLEGWSRVLDTNDDKKEKDTQSKPETNVNKSCSNDQPPKKINA